MAVLGVYVICWGLRDFLFFFSLCMYISSACWNLSFITANLRSFTVPHIGVCLCLFVELVFVFPYQKLLHWLGTVSLKSTVAKHKMFLEVFVKLYLLKYTVNTLLFETWDNWYCQTASLKEHFYKQNVDHFTRYLLAQKKKPSYIFQGNAY